MRICCVGRKCPPGASSRIGHSPDHCFAGGADAFGTDSASQTCSWRRSTKSAPLSRAPIVAGVALIRCRPVLWARYVRLIYATYNGLQDAPRGRSLYPSSTIPLRPWMPRFFLGTGAFQLAWPRRNSRVPGVSRFGLTYNRNGRRLLGVVILEAGSLLSGPVVWRLTRRERLRI